MTPPAVARVRGLCLALPEAHEVEAWGEATFRVRNKMFVMVASAGNHHGGGRVAIWCPAAAENQRLLIESDPERYFVPPYVGVRGWVGVWLDRRVRWGAVEDVVHDAYRRVAPKRLVRILDEP